MKYSIITLAAIALCTASGINGAYADNTLDVVSKVESVKENSDREPLETDVDLGEVLALLRQQQAELTAQRALLENQAQQIQALTQELESIRAPLPAAETPALTVATTSPAPDPPQTTKQAKAETGNAVAEAQADDPSRDPLSDFTGAWRLPGTNAALAIGGYVKTDIVYNFDALQIKDRFITGSIPVGVTETTGDEAQSSITANQSRLNFDLRTPTDYGIMRAFIEGDFAGDNDTFRLRHAFGQWRKMLAGKTWSTFMDPDASPEEIDFEGFNARINVRQAQLRFMPTFGEKYELQLALEDPNPEIQNGSGVTRTPDIVVAGRFQPRDRLHVKLALLLREIRGQDTTTGDVEKQWAWGTSLSGRFLTPHFDLRDSLLFQLNYGDAIGRYVNDLSSIGNYDGIFDPANNELQFFNVISGYASWQHWWGFNNLRSNFTFGAVNLNNPGFVAADSYKQTLRFSSNLIWSPIPRIDIGGEYLWGRRENRDGERGDASQVQLAVKYRF